MTAAHHGKAFHGGEHYENFPVGSWLVPPAMRAAVLALYRYARTGDDLADEGDMPTADRISALKTLLDGLHGRDHHRHEPQAATPVQGQQRHMERDALAAIGHALRVALDQRGVSIQPADDLIQAFLQDACHQPMANEAEVLAYCRYSANPIGRLVLGLAGVMDQGLNPSEAADASDAICTGLQLANFAQDMGQDVSRGRIYVPATWLDEMDLRAIANANEMQRARLAQRMAQWALRKLDEGAALPRMIRSSGVPHRLRLAFEIAMTIEGGREISRQVLANPAAVWKASPAISKAQLAMVVLRALRAL